MAKCMWGCIIFICFVGDLKLNYTRRYQIIRARYVLFIKKALRSICIRNFSESNNTLKAKIDVQAIVLVLAAVMLYCMLKRFHC